MEVEVEAEVVEEEEDAEEEKEEEEEGGGRGEEQLWENLTTHSWQVHGE